MWNNSICCAVNKLILSGINRFGVMHMRMRNSNWKKIFWPLLLVGLLLSLTGCTEPEPGKDAVLVVEQSVNKENGLRYVTNTMTWEQGKLVSMRFSQTFDTQDHAATAYLIREKELGDFGQLSLEDTTLSYNISIEPWETKTYAQMLEAMQKDDDWQVVEDLSGEIEPEDGAAASANSDDVKN